MKVNRLNRNSAGFPDSLKVIDRPPKQIYFSGLDPQDWLNKPRLAVVGSRKATAYGLTVTDSLVRKLAGSGIVIISGLAYGIDAAAHKAALAAGGQTVAVLPTSLDHIYPSSHINLARQIAKNGSLVSEYGPSDAIYKVNFTDRNRILTGLADAVLITEAAARSGTLTTARFALEQGKTVMVIPGNITSPSSEGCNNLIKSGALPVTDAADVFFALGLEPTKTKVSRTFRGTKEEETILSLIQGGVSDQEEIALKCEFDGSTVATVLISLELAGHIRPAGGGQWTTA